MAKAGNTQCHCITGHTLEGPGNLTLYLRIFKTLWIHLCSFYYENNYNQDIRITDVKFSVS